MRVRLEPLVGEEICVFTARTDVEQDAGYYAGTLRRLAEDALELRQADGQLAYVAFPHIVRFHRQP